MNFLRTHTSLIILISILLLGAVLRLYQLGAQPLSLFSDEVDAGYNAYSLIKTGRDYNGNFLPIHFESNGDYRAFLFIWSLAPQIAVFGLTPFAVRLGPALWGIAGIILIYLLTNQLTKSKIAALWAAFFLAIAPWHIHYSRAAFEITLMTSLMMLSTWLFLKSLKHPTLVIITSALFALNAYSYNVAKLYSPLLFIILIAFYWQQLKQLPRRLLITGLLTFSLCLLPLAYDSTLGFGSNRFNDINLVNHPAMEQAITNTRNTSPHPQDTLTKLMVNKYVYAEQDAINAYIKALSPVTQFVTGDSISARHSLPGFGFFYWWMAPLWIIGLITIVRTWHQSSSRFLLIWLLTSPLASIITVNGGDHGTRLATMIPPMVIIAAIGTHQLYQYLTSKPFKIILSLGLTGLTLISMAQYLYNYYAIYPALAHIWWNYDITTAVKLSQQYSDQYPDIYINDSLTQLPFLYYVFYTQYDPAALQQQFKESQAGTAPKPQDQIGSVHFRTIYKDFLPDTPSLYITTNTGNLETWGTIQEIKSPDPKDLLFMLVVQHYPS